MNSPNSFALWRHFGSREQAIPTEEKSRRFLGEDLRGFPQKETGFEEGNFSLKGEKCSRSSGPCGSKRPQF